MCLNLHSKIIITNETPVYIGLLMYGLRISVDYQIITVSSSAYTIILHTVHLITSECYT